MRYEHERALKPFEVEEPLDYFVFRRLAAPVARVLFATPVRPNHVTLAALAVGAAAGFGLGYDVINPGTAGLLLIAYTVLDCTDGQLARAKGLTSQFGRLLDGLVDAFVGVFVFVGATAWLARETGDPEMWTLASFAGAFAFGRAVLYDMFKNRYTRVVHPDQAEGDETLAEVWGRALAAWRARQWSEAFAWTIYTLHSPMFSFLAEKLGRSRDRSKATTLNAEALEVFKASYRPAIRLWATLGVSTHMFVLSLGLVFAYVNPQHLAVAYWFMVVPLSLQMIACFAMQFYAWSRFRREAPQAASSRHWR